MFRNLTASIPSPRQLTIAKLPRQLVPPSNKTGMRPTKKTKKRKNNTNMNKRSWCQVTKADPMSMNLHTNNSKRKVMTRRSWKKVKTPRKKALDQLKRVRKRQRLKVVSLKIDHQEPTEAEETEEATISQEVSTEATIEAAEVVVVVEAEETSRLNQLKEATNSKCREEPEEVDIKNEEDIKREEVTEESPTIRETNKTTEVAMREDNMLLEMKNKIRSSSSRRIWLQEDSRSSPKELRRRRTLASLRAKVEVPELQRVPQVKAEVATEVPTEAVAAVNNNNQHSSNNNNHEI
jgi:hypothetical protein